jgi:hypothetical protein
MCRPESTGRNIWYVGSALGSTLEASASSDWEGWTGSNCKHEAAQYIIERAKISHQHVAAGLTIPKPSTLDVRSHSDRPDMSVHLRNNLDTDEAMHRRRRDLEESEMRTAFTQAIKDAGYERPQFY